MIGPRASNQALAAPLPETLRTVIRPSSGWPLLDLREFWQYRELLYLLAWRDVAVRYKQTVLGIAWAVLQPLLTMVVFAVFFGRLGGLSRCAGNIPYPLFTLCALLPWQLFSHALSESSNSLVTEKRLLTKVYFPRTILPVAPLLSNLVDFAIAFVLLLGLMAWYGVGLGWQALTVPLFVGLAVLTALGLSLWLSALNALYRDVRYVVPFLTQFWMFATPVAYSSRIVPEPWRNWYGLNPMAGVIDGFRWALLGAEAPPGPMLAASLTATVLLLTTGLFFFRRMERTFADVI
jgi:lipopolysaccharide transport system permease protein